MNTDDVIRLLPRNVAAQRRLGPLPASVVPVAGNPASTRLEAGVGNCYPGLECDLRNLERRFFPFLEVDIGDPIVAVIAVDAAAARAAHLAGTIDKDAAATYRHLSTTMKRGAHWRIVAIHGQFGSLGTLAVDLTANRVSSIGRDRLPIDNWTAVRLLTADSVVTLTLAKGRTRRTLAGPRARYLGDDGALADFFRPGELTQSLCSPWTHDFRDCGCFYWASNHPDIAQPLVSVPPSDQVDWHSDVIWERRDRGTTRPPHEKTRATAADADALEMHHHEINSRWQELNFVVEGREIVGAYAPLRPVGTPLASNAVLLAHLRYAAGVELAVMHEYLAAAFSLREPGSTTGKLNDDIEAAHSEIMRVAIGEMRHIRAVNDVIRSLAFEPFAPALNVATQVPGLTPGSLRPVNFQPATPDTITSFIAVEAPSVSVDGYYTNILATLEAGKFSAEAQTIRTVMSEGADHWESFRFVQLWLGRHPDLGEYLAIQDPRPPPPRNAAHANLQQLYLALLNQLYTGYQLGIPEGVPPINRARTSMVSGLLPAAWDVAAAGFLVRFDPIVDARFAPLFPPP